MFNLKLKLSNFSLFSVVKVSATHIHTPSSLFSLSLSLISFSLILNVFLSFFLSFYLISFSYLSVFLGFSLYIFLSISLHLSLSLTLSSSIFPSLSFSLFFSFSLIISLSLHLFVTYVSSVPLFLSVCLSLNDRRKSNSKCILTPPTVQALGHTHILRFSLSC